MENYLKELSGRIYSVFNEVYNNLFFNENKLIPVYATLVNDGIADVNKLENYVYLFPDSRQKAKDKKKFEKNCKKSKIILDKKGNKHIHKKRNGSR